MATKFVYTDSEISEIVTKYKAGVSVDALAGEYAKSVASIRMKLVKLGVYEAKKASSTSTKTKTEVNSEFDQIYRSLGPALL